MEQAAAREIQSFDSGAEGSMALYLSARTKSVLSEMASNLANYCLKSDDARIENIAYTLQTGRNTFQQKAVIFVKDIGDAIVKLDAIAAGETEQYCNAETIENYEFPTDIVNPSIESVRSWINGNIDKIESPAFVFGNKISLPTYPFDLQSYWVEFERSNNRDSTDYKLNNKTGTPSEWFYEQSWQRKTLRPLKNEEKVENVKWLIFANSTNFSKQLIQQLPSTQDNIITVFQGDKFEKISDTKYKLNPDDFDAVFYPGGHGPLWDLANDATSIALIEKFNSQKKPIGFVCHAPAALKNVKDAQGNHLVKGKKVIFASTTNS